MFLRIDLVLLVMSFSCIVASSGLEQDQLLGDMEEFSRSRRSTERGDLGGPKGLSPPPNSRPADQTVQSPPQTGGGLPYYLNPNMQSSYFLGQCVMCPPGDPGPRGSQGPQGIPGRDGRDQIILGPWGEHTYATPPPATDGVPTSGVTYTRWGNPTCPSTSELVYQGVMASSNDQAHKGSGVDYLCLPLTPSFADTPAYGNGGAWVYGVEYETNLFTSRTIHQSEAPCAVCLAPKKETVLTIPGTNKCLGDQGWTLEYTGYMMSSLYTKYKSTFVCVDQDAEGIPRTVHNNNEALLYVANAKCSAGGGGLPCPPYVDAYDILCAVCTL